jgi:hypothetical protein
MSTTPQILKLVREGRVTPYDAALLLEVRSLVAANRDRVKFREQPVLFVGITLGVLLLSLFGIRRQD